MKRLLGIAVVSVVALSVAGVLQQPSFAAGEPKKESVRFKVLNTFKPDLAGIEKAQLIEFAMDPGAEVKSFKLPSTEILWVTKGVFTYKYGDRIELRKQGESWLQLEGIVLDVSNRTKGEAVLRGIQFIKAK